MASTETRLRQRIAADLTGLGCFVLTMHGSAYAGRGRPDLLVLHRRLGLFLEVKTPTGVLSPQQVAFQEKCRRLGIPHGVVHSVEEARQELRKHMTTSDSFDLGDLLDNLLPPIGEQTPAPPPVEAAAETPTAPKRTRRTKAQIAADNAAAAAEGLTNQGDAVEETVTPAGEDDESDDENLPATEQPYNEFPSEAPGTEDLPGLLRAHIAAMANHSRQIEQLVEGVGQLVEILHGAAAART